MPPKKTFTIGGMKVTTAATASNVVAGTLAMIKKEDRKKLDPDHKEKHFENLTKKQHPQFDLQPMTIASVKDLEDNYNLSLNLQRVHDHFRQGDMDDVFKIVFPVKNATGEIIADLELDASGTNAKQINLLDHYLSLIHI